MAHSQCLQLITVPDKIKASPGYLHILYSLWVCLFVYLVWFLFALACFCFVLFWGRGWFWFYCWFRVFLVCVGWWVLFACLFLD